MKNKIAKVCALSAVFSLFLSVSAFAGQQTRRVEYNNESFSSGYTDDYNVSHSIRELPQYRQMLDGMKDIQVG